MAGLGKAAKVTIAPLMHLHRPLNHFNIDSIIKSNAGSVKVFWLPADGDKASILSLDLIKIFNHRNDQWCHCLNTCLYWDPAGLETAQSHLKVFKESGTVLDGAYILFYATSQSLRVNEHFKECSLGIREDAFILKGVPIPTVGTWMNPSYEEVPSELFTTNVGNGESALTELVTLFNRTQKPSPGASTPIGSGSLFVSRRFSNSLDLDLGFTTFNNLPF